MLPTHALMIALLLPQGGREPDAQRLAAFRKLPPAAQEKVVISVQAALAEWSDPRSEACRRLLVPGQGLAVAEPHPVHDPKTYATGVAPERKRIPPDDERHRQARTRYPAVPALADLQCAVHYDFALGKIVRRAQPLGPDELLANDLAGYPRGSDMVLARVLQILDDAPDRQKAAYFGHAFANLDAECFTGITLYNVWSAGRELDIPDVDAVAFARGLLQDFSYVSPIPAGPRRTALYEKIARGFAAWRENRSTREAAAASFLSGDPRMSLVYKPLTTRFHYLFARHGEDVGAVGRALAAHGTRNEFLAAVDAEMKEEKSGSRDLLEKRRREWARSAEGIREAALSALASAGIAGQ